MPPYTSQHYLPAVYLREFSADQTHIKRNSKTWRCDGKANELVPVAKECCADYFYSREQAEEAEKMFQLSEGLFANCTERIKHGKDPTNRQFFGLILIIFDLHLRNAAYENQTGKNNLHAYSLRIHGFKKLLLGRKDDDLTNDEVWRHLKKRWRVRILSASLGNKFLTSDNPSILIASGTAIPSLQFAVLPVTPNRIAVALDCHKVAVVGDRTSPKDEELLNQLQLSNAVECVYSSVPLSMEEQQAVGERLNRKSKGRGKTDEAAWEASMCRLASGVNFSFMQLASHA